MGTISIRALSCIPLEMKRQNVSDWHDFGCPVVQALTPDTPEKPKQFLHIVSIMQVSSQFDLRSGDMATSFGLFGTTATISLGTNGKYIYSCPVVSICSPVTISWCGEINRGEARGLMVRQIRLCVHAYIMWYEGHRCISCSVLCPVARHIEHSPKACHSEQ